MIFFFFPYLKTRKFVSTTVPQSLMIIKFWDVRLPEQTDQNSSAVISAVHYLTISSSADFFWFIMNLFIDFFQYVATYFSFEANIYAF